MKKIKVLSILHIILVAITLLLIIIPWYQLGVEFPSFLAGGRIVIDSKYFLAGAIYILIILLKSLEYKVDLSKKKEDKVLVALRNTSDKILTYGLLILLAYHGFLSAIYPTLLLAKDYVVETMKKLSADNGRMIEKSFFGVSEKVILNLGIIFLLFYNLPFELWGIYFADACIMVATVIGIINGCSYYFSAKKILMDKK